MSCQTGIRGSESLQNFFAQCKNGEVRTAKMCIRDEVLELDHKEPVSGSWEVDWKRSLPQCLNDNEPCYVLFLLDTRSSTGQQNWVLISYAPDTAKIRDKMLLAATQATVKADFGECYITEEIHASSKDELTLEAFTKHLNQHGTPGPMSHVEQQLYNVKMEEATQNRFMAANSLAHQTLRGIAFPVDQEAEEKICELRDGTINYVQLSVDTLNEAIKLEKADTVDADQLTSQVPRNKPRYHFYRFSHTRDGLAQDSISKLTLLSLVGLVFLYSLPPQGAATIKERMLYSSCKGQFLDSVQKYLSVRIDRKMEVDAGEKIGEEFLLDSLYPRCPLEMNQPMRFAKPKAPGGLRRITKPV